MNLLPSHPQLYLASGSPRRQELLAQMGLQFQVVSSSVDEAIEQGETAEIYVRRLAVAKALAGANVVADTSRPVLGADTSVVIDNDILGKPRHQNDALTMLTRLSGRVHRVYTAVALVQGSRQLDVLSVSAVSMRVITLAEQIAYWQTGEPADKAGAYAIQGLGAVFVNRLEGSFSGVMGLPIAETAALLSQFGISIFSKP
jgi:septum formation protein